MQQQLTSDTAWVPHQRAGATTAVALTTLAALLTLAAATYDDDLRGVLTPELPGWVLLVGLLGLGLAVAGAWVLRARRPQAAAGLAAATAALLLPVWAVQSWPPTAVRGGLLAASSFAVGGLLQVALRWSPVSPVLGAWAERAVWALLGAAVLIHLLAYDPFEDPGCAATCRQLSPVLGDVLPTRTAVLLAGLLTAAAACLVLGTVLRQRDVDLPHSVAAALAGGLLVLVAVGGARVIAWGDAQLAASLPMLALAAVGTVGAAACESGVRTLRVRSAAERVVTGMTAPHGGMAALHGHLTQVQFALPGGATWVDAAGRMVEEGPERGPWLVLSDESGPAVRLSLRRPWGGGESHADLGPGTLLALTNTRLSAVSRARLDAVRASQRRIVEASDAERRRIERDLHDGAQQRLVSAAFQMRIARPHVDAAAAVALEAAEQHVRDALAHLRRLAHGMFPSARLEDGLEEALRDLVADSGAPVTLDVSLRGRLPEAVAMAAYQTVAAALRQVPQPTSDTVIHVVVEQHEDTLLVRAAVEPGRAQLGTAELVEAADRVGAVGGQLDRSEGEGGATVVTAVIPCVS